MRRRLPWRLRAGRLIAWGCAALLLLQWSMVTGHCLAMAARQASLGLIGMPICGPADSAGPRGTTLPEADGPAPDGGVALPFCPACLHGIDWLPPRGPGLVTRLRYALWRAPPQRMAAPAWPPRATPQQPRAPPQA